MIACPHCGFAAPDDYAFCPKCGTALAVPLAVCEERRVVTTLFCDLVGFTALGEDVDAEDVDALLRQYNALARKVVENHGGVVEKFIGDAVVAVFGVPAVHEDDPERAVRAGLRLVEAVGELPPITGHPVQVRIGINTGEALVRLDVTPGCGEGFLTGDAVNVGARLQSAAPTMGVVVGATTHELTEKAIVYEALEPVAVKGKRKPLSAWIAIRPVASTGNHMVARSTPFVGREVELDRLTALLDQAIGSCSPRIALIVGEPGIGKSRLVAELFAHIDAGPDLVTWRQGRCLPYGEGVTFWALAEIVKAHAGILETDDLAVVEAKLEQVLLEGDGRAWVRQRMRALLGLEAAKAEGEENFTAWLRFLEQIAAVRPCVLVLEDLHWAQEAFLDLLDFITLHIAPVPVMIVATARPELLERRRSLMPGMRFDRVTLEPLARDQIEMLVSSVLDDAELELHAMIAERAQGNPFFAEEAARLARDKTLAPGVPLVAGSVQAVIAARLDALPPAQKAVLADAAVAGDVFWAGLLGAMARRSVDDVMEALEELVAKQLIRPVRSSSMAGEREYAFGHVLSREVAYAQLPRRARARKHARVAAWIEEESGGAGVELAGLVAHHFLAALGLARMTRDEELAAALLEPTVCALLRSSRRARNVDPVATERQLSRALELLPTDDPRRPVLEAEWATVVQDMGDHFKAAPMLESAAAALQALGDHRLASKTLASLAYAYQTLGRDPSACLREALALLDGDDPSEEMVFVLQNAAGSSANLGRTHEGLAQAERALAAAEKLGLSPESNDDVLAALLVRGVILCQLGDATGLDSIRRGAEAALREGSAIRFACVYALSVLDVLGPLPAIPVIEECVRLYRDRGLRSLEVTALCILVDARRAAGRWGEALLDFELLEADLEAAGEVLALWDFRTQLTRILTYRGEDEAAADMIRGCLSAARDSGVAHPLGDILIAVAAVEVTRNEAYARSCLEEFVRLLRPSSTFFSILELPDVVRLMHAIRALTLAEELTQRIPTGLPTQKCVRTYAEALLCEASGEFEAGAAGFMDAVSHWHAFGMPYEEGHSLQGQGRCLVALGRAPEAAATLSAARKIFLRLGAKPALAETEAWLSRAGSR